MQLVLDFNQVGSFFHDNVAVAQKVVNRTGQEKSGQQSAKGIFEGAVVLGGSDIEVDDDEAGDGRNFVRNEGSGYNGAHKNFFWDVNDGADAIKDEADGAEGAYRRADEKGGGSDNQE